MGFEVSGDVLVVEDDPDINEMLGVYLDLEGFRSRHAFDGATALREVRALAPALVLLDLMLPDLDGLEVCRRLRADSATRDTRIVMLTALDDPRTREQAREYGVLEYLTKPFDPDAVIAAVRRHTNGARPREA